jgi:hypothetical protein
MFDFVARNVVRLGGSPQPVMSRESENGESGDVKSGARASGDRFGFREQARIDRDF